MFGRKKSKQQQVQENLTRKMEALEANASYTLEQLNAAVEDLRVLMAKEAGAGKQAGANLSRSAARHADRVVAAVLNKAQELEQDARMISLMESANSLGANTSTQAQEVLATFKERSVDLLAEGKRLAPEWKNATAAAAIEARQRTAARLDDVPDVRKQASKFAHDVADRSPELQEKGQAMLDRAVLLATDVAAQMREKAPVIQAGTSEFLEKATLKVDEGSTQVKERTPVLIEGISLQIASALAEAQKTAGPVIRDAANSVAEQVRSLGENVGTDPQQLTRNLADSLGSQKDSAVAGIQNLGSSTTNKIATTGAAVEAKSKGAAVAAGRGTKELGALIVWTAILGTIVYFAFLKPEHRRKVKDSARRIGSKARGVAQNIRGQDGEF